jgi:hypothetical protein
MSMSQMQSANQVPLDHFSTADLATNASLLVHDLPLLRVEWAGRRAVFGFSGAARDWAPLYRQPGRNLVDAYKFPQALRELRGLARDMEDRQ